MVTKANLKETTKDLIANIEGKSKAEAMDYLVPIIGFKSSELFWKDHGSRKGGFRAKYYEECLKRSFDKDSFIAYAKKNGANKNVISLHSHYVNISAIIERAKGLNG